MSHLSNWKNLTYKSILTTLNTVIQILTYVIMSIYVIYIYKFFILLLQDTTLVATIYKNVYILIGYLSFYATISPPLGCKTCPVI